MGQFPEALEMKIGPETADTKRKSVQICLVQLSLQRTIGLGRWNRCLSSMGGYLYEEKGFLRDTIRFLGQRWTFFTQ